MQTRFRCQSDSVHTTGRVRPPADSRVVQACVETLEDRRLLAASIELFSNGMLQIVGTSSDDTITLTRSGTKVVVQFNDKKPRSFTASGLRGIKIDAAEGNDKVKIAAGVRGAILRGNAGNDTLTGGDGADSLVGGDGTDILTGNNGNDTMDGGLGGDIIRGRSGFDTVSYKTRTTAVSVSTDDVANDGAAGEADNVAFDIEAILGGAGNDTLTGNAAANALYGGAGNDSLNGQGNADTLRGEVGDDTLVGGSAGDDFFGGNGSDTATYEGITANLVISKDNLRNDGEASEGDNVHDDVEIVIGGSGHDRLVGGLTSDTLIGALGNDTIFGGAGNDSISGGDGDDSLDGQAGSDTIVGDAGIDTVTYASRTTNLKITLDDVADDGDVSSGGEKDSVRASVEIVIGGSGNDTIVGSDGSNTLKGGAGHDSLDGGAGNDTLEGEAGADTVRGSDGNDRYFGGADVDTISFVGRTTGVRISLDGVANDGAEGETAFVGNDIERIFGSEGDDSIVGSDANELVYGHGGNDTIRGRGGNDDLFGYAGNDLIEGGAGRDVISGMDGDDTIIVLDGEQDATASGESGTDTCYADENLDPVNSANIEHVFYQLP